MISFPMKIIFPGSFRISLIARSQLIRILKRKMLNFPKMKQHISQSFLLYDSILIQLTRLNFKPFIILKYILKIVEKILTLYNSQQPGKISNVFKWLIRKNYLSFFCSTSYFLFQINMFLIFITLIKHPCLPFRTKLKAYLFCQ